MTFDHGRDELAMSIRNQLLTTLGPSLFPGICSREWLKLLHDNAFCVEPRYAVRAASIAVCSVVNSFLGWYEALHFREAIAGIQLASPLFILGHWRSGTTLLQNLFALDRRFACPTLFEVFFPHTFLVAERLFRSPLAAVIPPRRNYDNVRLGLDVPHEDEHALCTMTLCSPYVSLVFPERHEHYDRFLTFRGVPDADLQRWRAGMMTFLKKLTLKHHRPLVLKSPPHTARIRLLLEMFPEAKFLHIHRHPYDVFQSMLRLVTASSLRLRLQTPRTETSEDMVFRWYRLVFEAFFADHNLVPKGHLHEICFEDLKHDAVGVMRRSYEALSLPSFDMVEPDVRRYAATIEEYRTTGNEPLAPALRKRIASEWQRSFDGWGYAA